MTKMGRKILSEKANILATKLTNLFLVGKVIKKEEVENMFSD